MENDQRIRLHLQHAKIPTRYIDILEQRNYLSIKFLYSHPVTTLAFLTGIPISVCQSILNYISSVILPQYDVVSMPQIYPRFKDHILDQLIPIPDSGIVELVGQAGSGKTNTAIYLSACAAVDFPTKKVIYINTEGKFPTNRLQRFAEALDANPDEILSRVVIKDVHSVDELCDCIDVALPTQFPPSSIEPPSMVVIDSIASHFRSEFDNQQAGFRSQTLFNIATTLKTLSHQYKTIIVVTNQATANMSQFLVSDKDWVPSLGYAWSYCVNIRLKVSKTPMKREIEENGTMRSRADGSLDAGKSLTVSIRTFYVDISPLRQGISCSFYISDSGIHGV